MVFEKTGKCAPAILIAGVVGFIIVMLVGWVAVPKVVDSMIEKEVRLVEGSDTWNKWVDIPVPIYFKVYMFHVTNPDEVEAGAVPILEERGPYSYLEERHKVNISIDGDFVSYRQTIQYHFDRAVSVGDDSDRVNVINIPFVSAASIANNILGPAAASLVLRIIRFFSKNTESIIKRNVSVREFIFEGYEIPAYIEPLQIVQDLLPFIDVKALLPRQFKNDRFALYNGRNGTDVGVYTIYSGIEHQELFGEIFAIDGSQYLSAWGGKTCNMINGTDTTIFHPKFKKDQPIKIFHPDVCRSFTGYFERESQYADIPAYHFIVPEPLLEDPRVDGDNACFCPESKGNLDNCLSKGAIRLTNCYSGAPLVFSLPHYLYGNQTYLTQTIGLKPASRDLHDTYVDMEPNTGMVLKGFLRAQFNIELKDWPRVFMFDKMKPKLFPFMWIEEGGILDDENIEWLKGKFVRPMKIVTIVKWTFVGLSAATIIFGAGFVFYKYRQNS